MKTVEGVRQNYFPERTSLLVGEERLAPRVASV